MNPEVKYYIVGYQIVDETMLRLKYSNQPHVEMKEGLQLSNGRTIVDDRIKTPSQLVREGKYNVGDNIFWSSVFCNPSLYL